jgi:hypothetical protein
MTQAYEKVIKKKRPEIERVEICEQLGDLNPRYFEESMTLENALQKVHSSVINLSAKYNVFRPF